MRRQYMDGLNLIAAHQWADQVTDLVNGKAIRKRGVTRLNHLDPTAAHHTVEGVESIVVCTIAQGKSSSGGLDEAIGSRLRAGYNV